MAGLLDSLFDPSTYSGSNGLLDRLLPMLQYPTQQPGSGFPQSQEPQASPIMVGNYSMPRIGPASAYQPDPAALPPNAQPTQGQLPSGQPVPQDASQAMPLPPALGGNMLGGNFGAGLQSFVNTPGGLLPKLLGGISAGMTGQRTDPVGMQQQNLKAQYDSLVPVLGPQKALLAVMNPEAGKTLLQEALTNKEQFKTIKDALGGEHGYWINEREQTMRPAEPGGSTSGGSLTVGQPQILASGVQSYNPNLTGEDYLKQFSPEVQAAAKSYINGDVMPSGNPRTQGIANFAKTVAQKYGQDTGLPVSDATYAAKRKMQTDLASSGNSSIGGILSNGKSAFEHLKTYSDKLVDVGNVSHDYPLGGLMARGQNYIGNELGSSKQRGKVTAANEAGLKYGQESTKFYAGSGGGEGERMAALKANDATKASGEEMAGFLQAERDLMVGRLNEKEKQVREVMGDKWVEDHPIITAELKKTITDVDANIRRLRGEETIPDALSSNTVPGLKVGQSTSIGNITIKKVKD